MAAQGLWLDMSPDFWVLKTSAAGFQMYLKERTNLLRSNELCESFVPTEEIQQARRLAMGRFSMQLCRTRPGICCDLPTAATKSQIIILPKPEQKCRGKGRSQVPTIRLKTFEARPITHVDDRLNHSYSLLTRSKYL
jgi:hypothetical protein